MSLGFPTFIMTMQNITGVGIKFTQGNMLKGISKFELFLLGKKEKQMLFFL